MKPLYGKPVCAKCRNGFANRRQAAYIVDWFAIHFAPVMLFALLPRAAPSNPFTAVGGPPLVAYDWLTTVFSWALFLLFIAKDGFGGHSPGKALCGVQVVDAKTLEPIRFWASFKRNLVLLVPFGAIVVALTMMGGKRWGDGWAGTRVIWKKYRHRPVFDPRGIYCLNCGYDLTGNVSGRCPECFTFVRPRGTHLPGASEPDAADAPIERLTDA
jgi:uncharacterized RDD family membrane protein YckC